MISTWLLPALDRRIEMLEEQLLHAFGGDRLRIIEDIEACKLLRRV
jgi:hypothetical protein